MQQEQLTSGENVHLQSMLYKFTHATRGSKVGKRTYIYSPSIVKRYNDLLLENVELQSLLLYDSITAGPES